MGLKSWFKNIGKEVKEVFTKDIPGIAKDVGGGLKDIWEKAEFVLGYIITSIEVLIEIIKDIIKLLPKILEVFILVIKLIELGIDATDDMLYILPPFIILYYTSVLIKRYEYMDDLYDII